MSRERLRTSRENNSPFTGESVEIFISPTKMAAVSTHNFATSDYITIRGSDDAELLVPRQIALHSGYGGFFVSPNMPDN